MEFSLHRQLKEIYADAEGAQTEVAHDGFRIDVVRNDVLVEIQVASLSAIRDKVQRLLREHRVLVVKPIVRRKQLVWLNRRKGKVVRQRCSPKKGTLLDAFHELMYFTRVFPHKHLTLEIPLIDIEEWRYPGHGRRRRKRADSFQIQDRRLVDVHETTRLSSPADLRQLAKCRLPTPFHTGDLAKALGIERWFAQRIAYCFRHMQVARQVGKQRNALLYEFARAARKVRTELVA